jgi:hypothetical protein
VHRADAPRERRGALERDARGRQITERAPGAAEQHERAELPHHGADALGPREQALGARDDRAEILGREEEIAGARVDDAHDRAGIGEALRARQELRGLRRRARLVDVDGVGEVDLRALVP